MKSPDLRLPLGFTPLPREFTPRGIVRVVSKEARLDNALFNLEKYSNSEKVHTAAETVRAKVLEAIGKDGPRVLVARIEYESWGHAIPYTFPRMQLVRPEEVHATKMRLYNQTTEQNNDKPPAKKKHYVTYEIPSSPRKSTDIRRKMRWFPGLDQFVGHSLFSERTFLEIYAMQQLQDALPSDDIQLNEYLKAAKELTYSALKGWIDYRDQQNTILVKGRKRRRSDQ